MLKKKIRNITTKTLKKKKGDAKSDRKKNTSGNSLSSYLLPHPAAQRFSAPIRRYSKTGPKINIKHNTTSYFYGNDIMHFTSAQPKRPSSS